MSTYLALGSHTVEAKQEITAMPDWHDRMADQLADDFPADAGGEITADETGSGDTIDTGDESGRDGPDDANDSTDRGDDTASVDRREGSESSVCGDGPSDRRERGRRRANRTVIPRRVSR